MKKILSLLLCLLIISTTALPAFAESRNKCDCSTTPVIYVAVLGSASLYLDAYTETEKKLFRPDSSEYLKLVGELALPLAKFVADKDYEAFGDVLVEGLYDIFGMLKMEENGDSSDRIRTKKELPSDPYHAEGTDSDFYFGYDFREDPLTVADKLHIYIERVKEITGHDSVNILASSMGGVMTMAYFYKYGTEGVDACIFQCAPLQGTAVAGDLFTRKIKIDPDSFIRYAKQLPLEKEWQSALWNGLLELLYSVGAFHAVTGIANKIPEELINKVFDEFLCPVFGSMPGLWSFIPDDNYELAKEMVFDENVSDKLISRLDEYHYNVQCRAGEILRKAQSNGVKIMIVAGYNKQRTPLVESDQSNSDATVDAEYASIGGTVADIGTTLPEGYTQKNTSCGHSHIDEDFVVDASTCLLPENTWFIKDMLHSTPFKGHFDMYELFFYTDEITDVHSNEAYPQFLFDDSANETLIPMKNIPLKETAPTVLEKEETKETNASETDASEEIEIVNAQTGSSENISLIFAVAILAFAMMAFSFVFKKRKSSK